MGTDDLEFSIHRQDVGDRLVATGDIDVVNAAGFERILRDALAGTTTRLEVDLTGVDYLGSEGIRALVIAHRLGEESGVAVRVLPSPIVHRAIEVAGLQCWLDA